MEFKDKQYPYNILLSHWNASLILNGKGHPISLSVMEDENIICLSTTQVCNTGNTLYYIPVIPLYEVLQDKTKKRSAELLLSVCAYLYQVAGVPYYRDSYSAMDYYYEMMKEWVLDDIDSYEQTDLNKNLSEMNAADYYGDVMHRKLFSRYHLQHFQERITASKPVDGFEEDCLRLAKTCYELYTSYPEKRLLDNIRTDEEYDNEVIRAEQYISFIADSKGWLYENIEQMVNNEFNECSHMEEPVITQVFSQEQQEQKIRDLRFEYRLFELIADLCTILNEIP